MACVLTHNHYRRPLHTQRPRQSIIIAIFTLRIFLVRKKPLSPPPSPLCTIPPFWVTILGGSSRKGVKKKRDRFGGNWRGWDFWDLLRKTCSQQKNGILHNTVDSPYVCTCQIRFSSSILFFRFFQEQRKGKAYWLHVGLFHMKRRMMAPRHDFLLFFCARYSIYFFYI